MAETDKSKAIENAISQIEKQFGKGSIMKLGEAQQRMANWARHRGAYHRRFCDLSARQAKVHGTVNS